MAASPGFCFSTWSTASESHVMSCTVLTFHTSFVVLRRITAPCMRVPLTTKPCGLYDSTTVRELSASNRFSKDKCRHAPGTRWTGCRVAT
eukprot:3070783-Rhodomonas_salina.3